MHITPVSQAILERRRYFPRGLAQPEEGFRFSADALLLASFAGARIPERVLDMGTGCGVVGLGLLLIHAGEAFSVRGIDHDPAMIESAGANAAALGFEGRFAAFIGDIRRDADLGWNDGGGYDLVLCNPPYRRKGHGRMPVAGPRQSARFETSARLEDFIRVAARALGNKGRLAMVHLPEHLSRVFSVLVSARLEPKRLRFVHGFQHKPASLLLLEARKAVRPGLQVEPPLALYRRELQGVSLSGEARTFCPFLQCNDFRPK